MNEDRFKISSILSPISFVLSITAITLVVLDSNDFVKNSISKDRLNENINIEYKSQEKENEKIYQNEINDIMTKNSHENTEEIPSRPKEEMGVLIKDLEGLYEKNALKNQDLPTKKTKDSKISTGNIHKILLKSFIDKDDAILELNRVRLQHKDLTTKIETSIKAYKKNDEKFFGIFGKIIGDISVAEKYCEKFESRGIDCVIVS